MKNPKLKYRNPFMYLNTTSAVTLLFMTFLIPLYCLNFLIICDQQIFFQVPVETMCIPTHTQQKRRTLLPQMPPGWTAGCLLKSKYGSGVTNNNDECLINLFIINTGKILENILGHIRRLHWYY